MTTHEKAKTSGQSVNRPEEGISPQTMLQHKQIKAFQMTKVAKNMVYPAILRYLYVC